MFKLGDTESKSLSDKQVVKLTKFREASHGYATLNLGALEIRWVALKYQKYAGLQGLLTFTYERREDFVAVWMA